ncbi:MAG TPA: M67 family metallopeptidase [Pyrinomonadaceae bacterium]|nr:M67 family metallopeptidase [Pyrinomonadaceae bacterium]
MITLSQTHLDAIRRQGETEYPHECCGLLIGRMEADGRKIALELFPVSNAREGEAKRNRSLITPDEYVRGERHARSLGLDIIGNYHSHPDHPAEPSQFDLDHAWPTWSYVIVSVGAGQARDLRSWEMRADRSRFDEEEIAKGS